MNKMTKIIRTFLVVVSLILLIVVLNAPLNKPYGDPLDFAEVKVLAMLGLGGHNLLLYILLIVGGFIIGEASENKTLKLVALGLLLVNIIYSLTTFIEFNSDFFVDGKLPNNADLAYGYILLIIYLAFSLIILLIDFVNLVMKKSK